jgi:C4-dicarboxylate transporter, DctM subunit
MTPLEIGYLSIIIVIALLFSGMHIGAIFALIGFFGMVLLNGWNSGFALLGAVPYSTFADYGMSTIPLFILMGSFCFFSGISKDLYDAVHTWLGGLRGGLAIATIGACAGFAAVSGSSLATAATMGTVALPEMKRYNYHPGLATGAVAAGGTIGILIPPSIVMVIYGIITESSIGKLFLAGFLPGILEAALYMIAIAIICWRRPLYGPPGPTTSLKQKLIALRGTWVALILFALVIGGIYMGVFSPTEAAGIGACGAFILGALRRRFNWQNIKDSLFDTVKTTSMIFFIILGAMIYGSFLAVTRVPFALSDFITALHLSPYMVIACVIILYIILGCVIDAMAMILLTVPILYPLVIGVGWDPIWFGIMVVISFEMASITPPVGMNVFVIRGIAKDVPMSTIFNGILPFFICDLVLVVILIFYPDIALILPRLMK